MTNSSSSVVSFACVLDVCICCCNLSYQSPTISCYRECLTLWEALCKTTKLLQAKGLRLLVLSLASTVHQTQVRRSFSTMCLFGLFSYPKCLLVSASSYRTSLHLSPCSICWNSIPISGSCFIFTYSSKPKPILPDFLTSNTGSSHTRTTASSAFPGGDPHLQQLSPSSSSSVSAESNDVSQAGQSSPDTSSSNAQPSTAGNSQTSTPAPLENLTQPISSPPVSQTPEINPEINPVINPEINPAPNPPPQPQPIANIHPMQTRAKNKITKHVISLLS